MNIILINATNSDKNFIANVIGVNTCQSKFNFIINSIISSSIRYSL